MGGTTILGNIHLNTRAIYDPIYHIAVFSWKNKQHVLQPKILNGASIHDGAISSEKWYHLFGSFWSVSYQSRAAQVSQLARFSTPFRLACSLRTSQTWRSFTPTNQGFRSLMICQAKIVRKQVVTQMGDR